MSELPQTLDLGRGEFRAYGRTPIVCQLLAPAVEGRHRLICALYHLKSPRIRANYVEVPRALRHVAYKEVESPGTAKSTPLTKGNEWALTLTSLRLSRP